MGNQPEIKTELEFFKKMHELLTLAEITKYPRAPSFTIKDPKDGTVYYFQGLCSLIYRMCQGNFGVKSSFLVEEVKNIMLVYKYYFNINRSDYVYWFTTVIKNPIEAKKERLNFLGKIIKELTKLHS